MLEANGELLEDITSSKMALIRKEGSGMQGVALAMQLRWDSKILGVQGVP